MRLLLMNLDRITQTRQLLSNKINKTSDDSFCLEYTYLISGRCERKYTAEPMEKGKDAAAAGK